MIKAVPTWSILAKNLSLMRVATARSSILVNKEIHEAIVEHKIGKGDVLAVAQVAGIMAAKRTSDIIPMCHPFY